MAKFLDRTGLNSLWMRIKEALPFRNVYVTGDSNGWLKIAQVRCASAYMNTPIVFHLICRGFPATSVEIMLVSQNGTTPGVKYFVHRTTLLEGSHGLSSNVGYTYADVDGVRTYTLWKKKNDIYGGIYVHAECAHDWAKFISYETGISYTEPEGIVYADERYDHVKKMTAYSAKGSSTKIPQITTNSAGQVTLIDEVAIGNAPTATNPLATKLTASDDLNDIKGDGKGVWWYYWESSSVPTNARSSATSYMEVVRMHNGNYLFQTVYEATNSNVYVRICNNGTWGAWYRCAKTSEIPEATTTTPKMDGTAAVGSETTWAKGDHVHPSDTSRVPTTRKVNGHALSADVTVTAADVSAVRYDTNAQGLNDTQKGNARTNIGAGTSNLALGTSSTTAAKGDHTHGNITNGGALQTNDITIASGDKLVVTDSSDSSKVARASISFDGSTTTTALTPKGTFEAFAKSSDITTAIQALDVSSVGGDGKYISAISETDGKISATSTTMDTTPTASSTKAVTSGGIKTALDKKVGIANVSLEGQSTTILAQVQSMASSQIHYKRFYTSSDGGSANISDKPTGTTNGGFMLEAYCNRYASSSDWRYVVLCYVQATRPKIAWIKTGDTSIWWQDLNTDSKVTQTKDDSGTTSYPMLMAGATDPNGIATTARYDSGVKLTPSTNTISANISGNAATASAAQTGSALETAINGKQDALNVVLVSYNVSTLAEVATLVNGGKAPVCIRSNQLYVCDGLNYGTSASPEYRFSHVEPNTATTPRIIYVSVNSSGWSSSPSIIQLALDSAKMKIDDADNPDYDGLTASGIYRITSSASPTTTGKHSPENGRMTLIVINTDNFVAQMAMGYDIYFRYKKETEFETWKNVVTSDSKVKIDVSGVVGTENDTLYFT